MRSKSLSGLSPCTMRTYEDVIGLLRDCLNGYGPNTLDEPDHKRREEAYQDDEEAFCHLFGLSASCPMWTSSSDTSWSAR